MLRGFKICLACLPIECEWISYILEELDNRFNLKWTESRLKPQKKSDVDPTPYIQIQPTRNPDPDPTRKSSGYEKTWILDSNPDPGITADYNLSKIGFGFEPV